MDIELRLLVGAASALLMGPLFVRPITNYMKRSMALVPPNEAIRGKWEKLTKASDSATGGTCLGCLERLLFFGAAWLGCHQIIAGWLAFKVASKWQVWSIVIFLPERLTGVDDIDYLIARYQWGAQRLASFLVGTSANIVSSYLCMLLGREAIPLWFK